MYEGGVGGRSRMIIGGGVTGGGGRCRIMTKDQRNGKTNEYRTNLVVMVLVQVLEFLE